MAEQVTTVASFCRPYAASAPPYAAMSPIGPDGWRYLAATIPDGYDLSSMPRPVVPPSVSVCQVTAAPSTPDDPALRQAALGIHNPMRYTVSELRAWGAVAKACACGLTGCRGWRWA